MTYDESGEAKNPAHLTEDDLPKKPKKPTSRRMVVVMVVVIAGVVGGNYLLKVRTSPNLPNPVIETIEEQGAGNGAVTLELTLASPPRHQT